MSLVRQNFAHPAHRRKAPRRWLHVRMRSLGLPMALAAAFAVESSAAPATIDLAREHQVIRGFGGATVFQPPDLPASLSAGEIDTLFGNGPDQIGFTILRIRVAPDETWRAIELAHAQAARAHGAIVMATPWSPPASMKSNGSLIDGYLKPSAYAEYASYLNDFAGYMAANGAPLYAISVQNEPDIEVSYESCDWTPAQMLEFCRDHADAIRGTRVMAPESFQFLRAMSDPILNDDVAAANVDVIGGHIYGGGLADYPLARSKGKEVWMTEHLDLSTDWAGALGTGKEIHDCLAVANFNAYIWWYLRRFYGPLGEDGIISKRGHVMSQFAKFVRPGFVRIEATVNPAPGVFVSAYKRDKLVIVAINQSASSVSQAFAVESGSLALVTPWVTSESESMAGQPAIPVAGGGFAAKLPAGSITTFVGDLVFSAPSIVSAPRGHVVARGDMVVLDVAVDGAFPEFQWYRNGVPIPGADGRVLTIRDLQESDAGAYAVTVRNSGGEQTSGAAVVEVVETDDCGRLANISTRSFVGVADAVQIAGFVVSGTEPKPVLIRAAGPVLATSFGLDGVLSDPWLELHAQAGDAILGGNDNWEASLGATFSAVYAFTWPQGSRDAALLASLDPGAYTAVVRGLEDGTGVALVEVYDAGGSTSDSALVNLSTRSYVGVDDAVQIAGFVVGGTTARTLVIRASGPALEAFGLDGLLADPVIELHDQASGAVLAVADDWEAAMASHFDAVHAFAWPEGSRDAALVASLDPGSYTVVVRGKDRGTGVALAEVYEEL